MPVTQSRHVSYKACSLGAPCLADPLNAKPRHKTSD
jgi:hypothetical protein